MARKWKGDSKISFRLEEEIPVPLHLVGRPEWLRRCVSPEARLRCADPRQHTIVKTTRDLQPVLQHLRSCPVLAVDTETTGPKEQDGLDPVSKTSRLVIFQIGTPERSYGIEPDLVPHFGLLLQSEDHLKLLQNAVHDFRFLYAKYGVEIVRIYDTMLAEQLLRAGRDGVSVGLADLVRRYPPYHLISKGVRDEFIQHSGLITQTQLYYALRDIHLLYPVYQAQSKLLQQEGMRKVAKLEFENIPVCAEMTLTGVRIDIERNQDTVAYHTGQLKAYEELVLQIYNESLAKLGKLEADQGQLFGPQWHTFKLGSSQEKLKAFHRLGIHLPDTETDTLIRVDHPMALPLVEWSVHNKIVSTYQLWKKIHPDTGRFHPEFHQLGAGERAERGGKETTMTIATGRWSGNFQQLPKPEGTLVRMHLKDEQRVRAHFAQAIETAGTLFRRKQEAAAIEKQEAGKKLAA